MKRNYKLDNAKAILIFLVVLGHLFAPLTHHGSASRNISLWIFSFHMPAFIFVSGLLRKPASRFRWEKFIGFVLSAYSLQFVLYLTKRALGMKAVWSWIYVSSTPWYLLALAGYEVIFYLVRRLKPQTVIIASVISSLLIGFFNIKSAFGISRMINFMPLYALGYYSKPDRACEWLEERKKYGWIIMSSLTIFCLFVSDRAFQYTAWFAGRKSYAALSLFDDIALLPHPCMTRLFILVVEIVLTLAFISIVPNRKTRISEIGKRSSGIYYWHRSICYVINCFPLYSSLASASEAAAITVYIIIAAAICLLLSCRIFAHPMSDLMKLPLLPAVIKEKGKH